jgi:putative flippase GtrA
MRFVRFNGVGLIGFAVQLGVLGCLLHVGLPYLLATALAVEASVLNNFVWHERWTWRDRPASGRMRLIRFIRFHLLNGLVSLGGNVLIVWALVGEAGLHPVLGNVIAVLACGIVNYFGADRVVFDVDQETSRSADRNASATKVNVAFVQPPVGSVGDPATNRFS